MKAVIGFTAALAVVLLIVSAANMGSIGNVERSQKSDRDRVVKLESENATLRARAEELQADLNKARNDIITLQGRTSTNVEELAEKAAKRSAEEYLKAHKDEIAAEAAKRVDLSAVSRDVSSLRTAVEKINRGELKGEEAAKAVAEPVAKAVEPVVKAAADRAAQEAGVQLTEEQQKKAADTIGKGVGEFMSLMQQRRDGKITEEEFRQKMNELRERSRAEFESSLTPEQREAIRQRMEEMRNRQQGGGAPGGGANPGGGGAEAF